MVSARVGSFVADWIDRPGAFAVLGVRRDLRGGPSAFWAACEERVLWFDERESALGPFGALGRVPATLEPGETLAFAGGAFRRGDEVLVAAGCTVEDTRVPSISLSDAEVETRSEELMLALDDLEPASGWLGDAFARSRRLFVAALQGDADATEAAGRLVGLGEGLTPRGDDYLGGVLLVSRALGIDPPFSVQGIESAFGSTTLVARAQLHAHARGHGARACRDLLAAIGRGDDVHPAVTSLLELGHTSGRDLALGVSDGLAASVRPR